MVSENPNSLQSFFMPSVDKAYSCDNLDNVFDQTKSYTSFRVNSIVVIGYLLNTYKGKIDSWVK